MEGIIRGRVVDSRGVVYPSFTKLLVGMQAGKRANLHRRKPATAPASVSYS